MKKRIVIVDDRPWKFQESIQSLQKAGVRFYKTIFYPNNMIPRVTQDKYMDNYKKVTGMDVIEVNDQSGFLARMDELYADSDVIFLMDYDLKGDMNRNDFFTRINIKYALEKDRDEKRIWFYTSGPNDIKGLLRETFHDNIISVPSYAAGALEWDEEQVKAAAEG